MKRGNRVYNMNATMLVPGDRIILSAGAAVPADCTLCEGKPLQVDQAALTGEPRTEPARRPEAGGARRGTALTTARDAQASRSL